MPKVGGRSIERANPGPRSSASCQKRAIRPFDSNSILPRKSGSAVVNGDTEYDQAVWIRTYVRALRRLKPELRIEEAARLGREAFDREGRWQNPKIAAWGDALFGPLLLV